MSKTKIAPYRNRNQQLSALIEEYGWVIPIHPHHPSVAQALGQTTMSIQVAGSDEDWKILEGLLQNSNKSRALQ